MARGSRGDAAGVGVPAINAGLYFGGAILLLVLACALVPGLVTPGDPLALNLAARLAPPGQRRASAGHRRARA